MRAHAGLFGWSLSHLTHSSAGSRRPRAAWARA